MNGAQGISFTGTVQLVAAASSAAGQAVVGITMIDTSAAANTVEVYDGTSTSGKLVGALTVASGAADSREFTHPRMVVGGVYVKTTGACRGTVWIA